MSDDEDNQSLLDEIEALDNVLSQKSTVSNPINTVPTTSTVLQKCTPKQEINFESDPSQHDVSEDLDEESDAHSTYENYSCNDLKDLLEMNKKLIESVLKARDKAICLLDECVTKQEMITVQINKVGVKSNKIVNLNAGMPYFKDKNYYTPKRNEDTETKIRNNELRLTELQRIHRWNHMDKSRLLKAVREEVASTVLKKNENEIDVESTITKTSQLPAEIKEAIGSLGSMQLDWLKIANRMPENKHTAEECEVMWNIFLHPNINKQKWTSKEDKNLNSLAEKYESENWDAIAKDLGTNRSGYQCFIRYNTNNWKNLMKGQCWSNPDDNTLTHLVNKLKIGDYIPWGYIASCMSNYTKQQVYFRWNYSLAPHLKKGRFSAEEDQQLIDAVQNYGPNFSKIAALVMTSRTNIQLKEHYGLLVTKQNSKKSWTLEEDQQLLTLHGRYGHNWVRIVKEMPGINRVQARLRYSSLKRYEKRGINAQQIQRQNVVGMRPEHTVVTYMNTPWSRENKEIVIKHLKIDDLLINFFKKTVKKNSNSWIKTYNPIKLKEDTKRLYDILVKLNANLDNLTNFDFDFDFDADEMNLQLLSSLQNYINERQSGVISEEVKLITLKMCGSLEPAPMQQRFIPPLPFDFRAPKSKTTKSKGIDYIARPDEHSKLELDMIFDPNKQITDYLGEDIDYQFEKIKYLFSSQTITQKRVYSLKCKQFARAGLFSNYEDNIIYPSASNAKKMKYDWECNQMIPTDSSKNKNDSADDRPQSFIEPNRAALVAYQEILLNSASFPTSSSETDFQYKLTHNGREALHAFRKRYEQIFHIPSGLSKIIPPDIVDDSAFLPAVEKFKRKKKPRPKRLKLMARAIS